MAVGERLGMSPTNVNAEAVASRARDRRLGEVIDGDVPITADEWALVDAVALLRGESHDDAPPPELVASVLAMARDAQPPRRRRRR